VAVVVKPARRGQCPVCRYRWRLRADGTIQAHTLYSGRDPHPCDGAGQLPAPFNYHDCGECLEHRFRTPGLAEAFASVGIEHGESAGQTAVSYFAAYHDRGHRDSV